MFLLAIQLILGHQRPWLPEKMLAGSMKLETVQKFAGKAFLGYKELKI